jgi:biotin transport system substrate-specific component
MSLAQTPQVSVLADLIAVPRTAARAAAHNFALVLGGAAFIGLLAQIAVPLPFTPVPLTGQTFGVVLAAAALGKGRGVGATTVYGVAGVAGVPWFAGGTSGWAAVSFGYVLGFVAAAALVGWLAQRSWDRGLVKACLAMLAGSLSILLFGTAWLGMALHVSPHKAFELGFLPFVPGDLIKVLLAVAVLPSTWWLAGHSGRHGVDAE